ncbi:unnamed protein product [Polarella glacialis]|uniref:Uncharacterized protein n=1 Tax=Polarella glacialis TaxID=89957 RepID=A0A813I0V2_POLGL|nr:unnamed protein product [Polarella glacialis]
MRGLKASLDCSGVVTPPREGWPRLLEDSDRRVFLLLCLERDRDSAMDDEAVDVHEEECRLWRRLQPERLTDRRWRCRVPERLLRSRRDRESLLRSLRPRDRPRDGMKDAGSQQLAS